MSEKKLRNYRKKRLNAKEEKLFFKNLYIFGYPKIIKNQSKKNMTQLIIAFQRRFRQILVNGKIDQECLIISKNILKS